MSRPNTAKQAMPRQWIGGAHQGEYAVGQFGFLVERQNVNHGTSGFELQDMPARGNQSHAPIFEGWCGTTNDVAVYAHGMAKVIKLARNGRALTVQLEDKELAAALEELGYPGLAE